MSSELLLDMLVAFLRNGRDFMVNFPWWLWGLFLFIFFPTFHISHSIHYEMQSLILSNGINDRRITKSESEWFLKGILHGHIYCAFGDLDTAKQLLSQPNGKKAFMQKYLKGLRQLDQEDRNAIRKRGLLVPRWRIHSLATIHGHANRKPHGDPVMYDKGTRNRHYSGFLATR